MPIYFCLNFQLCNLHKLIIKVILKQTFHKHHIVRIVQSLGNEYN